MKIINTKRLTGILGCLLALILTISLATPALALPQIPHQFWGQVTIEGGQADEGTPVSAKIDGTEYASTTVDADGYYGYDPLFRVPADDPDISGKDGAYVGDLIEFYVADALATTFTFQIGGHDRLDLTVGEVPAQYSLTVASTAGGEVTTPGEGTFPDYAAGTEVALLAEPDTGYEFVNWTGDVGTVANVNEASTTITMNADYSIQANFGEIGVTYTLTISSTTGGSVTEPVEAISTHDSGTVVNLLAVADTGYQFANWTGDTADIANINVASTTITMNGNYTITANFEIGITYDLTVASGDNGSVTTPGEGTFTYNASDVVNLVASPDTGYTFVNWTGEVGDVANVNAASTTITMNGDYSITANFVEVTGDLGELIIATPSGGTLDFDVPELGPGTYSGNVTINKPITITGTEGVIISGGILIEELTGSNVTVENLTITDYINFGIKIVKVRADDVFIIRNNTFEGVEGSVIGIQVDAVEAGGILEVEQNSITGNEIGIKLLADVADGGIQFNDITGNTIGLEQLAEIMGAYAGQNWWGDISGPGEENWNPGGIGDNVTGNIGYFPWLTRDFKTVIDDNIAYFGLPAVELNTGWNIISTPIALDPLVEWVDSDNISRTGVDTWGDYIALGDGLSTDNMSPAWRFDGESQAWVVLSSDSPLKPCDAIYVRMASDDIAPILYSPDVSVPSKDLYSGWNLVSLAWLPSTIEDVYGLPADEALITVEEVTGSHTGYKLVVSPGVNTYESTWIYIAGDDIEPWTDPNIWPPPDDCMVITSGYWVFMLNDGTLAGFAFTPISLRG